MDQVLVLAIIIFALSFLGYLSFPFENMSCCLCRPFPSPDCDEYGEITPVFYQTRGACRQFGTWSEKEPTAVSKGQTSIERCRELCGADPKCTAFELSNPTGQATNMKYDCQLVYNDYIDGSNQGRCKDKCWCEIKA